MPDNEYYEVRAWLQLLPELRRSQVCQHSRGLKAWLVLVSFNSLHNTLFRFAFSICSLRKLTHWPSRPDHVTALAHEGALACPFWGPLWSLSEIRKNLAYLYYLATLRGTQL